MESWSQLVAWKYFFFCSSSIYGFWLPLWCLQTLLTLYEYDIFLIQLWHYVCLQETEICKPKIIRRDWRYKRVIRIRTSKDRQHISLMKNDKRTNNDLRNINNVLINTLTPLKHPHGNYYIRKIICCWRWNERSIFFPSFLLSCSAWEFNDK